MRQFHSDNPSHFHEIVSFYKTYTKYRYIKISGFIDTFSPKIATKKEDKRLYRL